MSTGLVRKQIYVQPTIGKKGHFKTVLVRVGEEDKGENKNVRDKIDGRVLRSVKETVPRTREGIENTGSDESRGARGNNIRIGNALRYASSDKQYESEGYKLGRWANTVIPESNAIPESVIKYLNLAQRDFINLAVENYAKGNKSILNFDGTGTGKTRQEIGLAQTYLEKNPNAKVLIVTESDTIIDNAFKDDSIKMQIPINKVKGGKIKEGQVNVTTYSTLDKVGKEFDLVIFDEAHNMKNADSTKAINGVELLSMAKNTALFTATPVDKPDHLHYITSALNLNFADVMDQIGIQSREIRGFDGKYKTIYTPKEGLTRTDVASGIEKLFNTITDMGLAVKREVSLSNLKMDIKTVPIPDQMVETINSAYAKFLTSVESVQNPLIKGRVKATGLMKMRGLLESVKVQETIDRTINAIQNGEQVVIVGAKVNDTTFNIEDDSTKFESVGSLQAIANGLRAKGIPVVDYFGSNKDKNGVKKFQNGEIPVFITTPQSGGTGISLDDNKGDKPRRMLLTSFPFSANSFVQVIGRVNRKNTKSVANVEAIYVDHPVDNWNKSIIGTKIATLGASVSGDYARINSDTLALVESVESEDVAQAIMQNNTDLPKPKVSGNDSQILDVKRMKRESNVVAPKQSGAVATYKSMGEYLRTVPVASGGVPSTNFMWKDAKIQLGMEKVLISELIRTKPEVALYYIKRSLSPRGQEKIESGEFGIANLEKVKFAGSITPKDRLKTDSLTKSILNEGIEFLKEYLEEAEVKPDGVFFAKSQHFGHLPKDLSSEDRHKFMELERFMNSDDVSSELKDQASDQAKQFLSRMR